MDKQEYKLRAEEIKALIAKRDFFGAAKIADEIDWTRVRSVAMLCTVSDLYKANRKYKESKELLLLAYERHPNGRMIVYSLCELCIKMGEVVDALKYFNKFIQLAPMDNGKYVLQYKLYVAQEVSLEERIAILEQLKKRDYREKWGYELAYLYHRVGLTTKCVEECDELILWFSDGRYVKKAMELKMLHQPLTVAQEASYNAFIGKDAKLPEPEPVVDKPIEEQIKEPSVNIGQYDTLNLQKALAESMKAVLSPVIGDSVMEKPEPENLQKEEEPETEECQNSDAVHQNTYDMKEIYFDDSTGEMVPPPAQMEEIIITEETTLKAGEEQRESVSEKIVDLKPEEPKPETSYYVPDDATKEIPSIREIMGRSLSQQPAVIPVSEVTPMNTDDGIPSNMVRLLTEEYDGQISLVVEEKAKVEKQITGQMNIEEVLEEWEKTKKEYEEKRKAERLQKVKEQTGSMFTEFEAKVRDGILEQLEKEQLEKEQLEREQLQDVKEKVIWEDIATEAENEQAEDAGITILTEADLEEEKEVVREIMESYASKIPEDHSEKSEEVIMEKDDSAEKENAHKSLNLQNTAALEKLIQEEAAEEEKAEKSGNTDQKAITEQEVLEKIEKAQEEVREMNEEERALFAPFIQTKRAKKKFMKALDQISLAAYTGNVIVTGDADSDTLKLAKNIIKDIQMTDANFSGVIAKVSGSSLNSKSVEATIAKLNNGGLIIEKASEMNRNAVTKLLKALDQEKTGIVVILEDSNKAMKRMLAAYPEMSPFFNVRVEVEQLSNDALAAYGKQYAAHLEYSIDALGMLALQTKIEERQTSDHIVTVAEVRELIEDAIYHVNRKNLRHLLDFMLGKRYDNDDMIILREKDFM